MVTSWAVFSAIFLAALCICTFSRPVFFYYKRRASGQISFLDRLEILNWVNVKDFRKLIDPHEEAALRESRSRTEFGKLQVARIASAEELLKKMLVNAETLQELGYKYFGPYNKQTTPKGQRRQRTRQCRERAECPDDTRKWLAHRLINFAVPVKMGCRITLLTLFLWKRLAFLDRILISRSLADLKDLLDHTLGLYQELREAALMLAAFAEPGVETELVSRI